MRQSTFKARQRGQLLPFASAFLVLCLALFYFAANTAQMGIEKTRVINAADAAAYSAGIVQARSLNLTAYTNRAIIANQVGVAQMLTLNNELNHLASFYSATDASVIEVLGEGIGWATIPTNANELDRYTKHAAITAGSLVAQFYGYSPEMFLQYIVPYSNYIGSVVITAANTASTIMEGQMRMLWEPGASIVGEVALAERSLRIAQEVAQTMDPDIRVEISPTVVTSGAASMVRRYADDDRNRVQEVVLGALAPEIVNRDENAYSQLTNPLGINTGLERRGRTYMTDLDTWQADDYQNYRYWSPSLFRPRRTRTTSIEGAWTTLGPDDTEATYLSYVHNETTINEFFARYSGLPSIYDLDDEHDSASTTTPFRPGVTVVARKAKDRTKTSGHVASITPSGRLDMFEATPAQGDEISAMARAQIIFNRPARDDGFVERPNLYNPYWTVRLATPTGADYLYYAARRFWN